MGQKSNKYLVISICAGLIVYVAILLVSPAPLDWSLSFSKDDSVPFGCEILFNEFDILFPEDSIKTCHSPIYNFTEDATLFHSNIVYINTEFKPDDVDLNRMLNMVNNGNNIFIAAATISDNVQDSLHFKLDEEVFINLQSVDSTIINFVNPTLKSPWGYTYTKAFQKVTFESYDTLQTTVLGIGDKALTNFVKIKYGHGNFYINCNPLAFTNYNLLVDENYEYAFKALSYLPKQHVIWDEFYKEKAKPSASVLRYILSQKGLKYAWYILLFGVVTYLIFGGKRKQRAIPVFSAPKNTTLTFIETIGRLYYKRKNHFDIANKKFKYFLEFLRTKYYIDTSALNDDLYKEISEKCNVSLKTIRKLFSQARRLEMSSPYTEEDLEQFSRNIEFVYHRCRKSDKM